MIAWLACSRLHQMDQTCEVVRQECSRRVTDVEKRLQMTAAEKDALKVSLHEAEMEVSRRQVVVMAMMPIFFTKRVI